MYFYVYETNKEFEIDYTICDGYIENSGLDYSFEYHLEYNDNFIYNLQVWDERTKKIIIDIQNDEWVESISTPLKMYVFMSIDNKYNLNIDILSNNNIKYSKINENVDDTKKWLDFLVLYAERNNLVMSQEEFIKMTGGVI